MYYVLDEIIMGGMVLETNIILILRAIEVGCIMKSKGADR